jgi:hypothetical protein
MIEMATQMIAAILGLIKKGELNEASKELENVFKDFLKKDSSFFEAIPEEEMTDRLLKDHNYTNGHLEILAELLNAEAELKLAQGNRIGSLELSRKSLKIFEFLDNEQKTYSFEKINKMEEIRKRIEGLL